MLRVIGLSLLALLLVVILLNRCGPDSQAVQDRLLLAELNREAGEQFRDQQARREGVLTLPSGLQLELLQVGEGQIPAEDTMVRVHYRGFHLDGREFENSYRRGEAATVPVRMTIPGWREALMMMPEGSIVRLVLPYWLAYGEAGAGKTIGPAETLVFELELLNIEAPPQPVPAVSDF
ncbi:FKBP-type peptidyl-prolyl cis-trans isomerase [Thiorhodospira sibirica]|uniref:FKBP-type peptidyl-prolyl cis-trans isomerase n=1 Tax=Thiorhodospira sibirica TaxID=154347 RepID=UPI00022C1137|nr:FKBP-type peptidyl-prolyl cis-trans isomerase [Thiorhodospira sibirica]